MLGGGIGPKRAEKILELRNRGAFTMAELVVASGKPCVEWRELISTGRVEPFEEEGSVLSAPPPEPLTPAVLPRPLPNFRVRLRVTWNAPGLRLASHALRQPSRKPWRGFPVGFSGSCPRSVVPLRTWRSA